MADKHLEALGAYRSMILISGETKPDAQVAAVRSEATRHGRLLVFHCDDSFKGKAFEVMMLGFGVKVGSPPSASESGRPSRSTSRVMVFQHAHMPIPNAFECQQPVSTTPEVAGVSW